MDSSERRPFLVLVALINPNEVPVPAVAAGPVEAINTSNRLPRGVERRALQPPVAFGVPVSKRNRAGLAVENSERVHPTFTWLDVDDSGAQVAPPRDGLFQKHQRICGRFDVAQFQVPWLRSAFIFRSFPLLAVHAISLAIT